jgi:hypothetical protein
VLYHVARDIPDDLVDRGRDELRVVGRHYFPVSKNSQFSDGVSVNQRVRNLKAGGIEG